MDCRRLFITGGNFPLTVPLPSAVFWGQTPFEARKHWLHRDWVPRVESVVADKGEAGEKQPLD